MGYKGHAASMMNLKRAVVAVVKTAVEMGLKKAMTDTGLPLPQHSQ